MTATAENPAEYQARINGDLDRLQADVNRLADRIATLDAITKETDTDD